MAQQPAAEQAAQSQPDRDRPRREPSPDAADADRRDWLQEGRAWLRERRSSLQQARSSLREERQADSRRRRSQRPGLGQGEDRQPAAQRSARLDLEPRRWVQIAVDRNHDGRFDAVQSIYLDDLQVAQQRSRQREREQLQRASRNREQPQRDDRPRRRGVGPTGRTDSEPLPDRQQELQGTVGELSELRLPGHQQRFLMARIRTPQGRVGRVLLGASDRLGRLELRQGDRISVAGRLATINDQMMLVAERISANGRTLIRQPAGDDQQTAGDDQQTAGDDQQTAGDDQQAAGDDDALRPRRERQRRDTQSQRDR